MLVLEDLHKRFGEVTALDGVSFTLAPGQLVGFLGPNGAGKTTAMRAILRLLSLDDGRITWKGLPVDDQTRRHVGYMPAERGLYPRMRVGEHIEYLGRLAGLSAEQSALATGHWLGRLGLSNRADDEVQSLSTGNMQRVQLALALVHDPQLLVLDEPFAGLDPMAVATMRSILEERIDGGGAVLFSSHQLDLVQDLTPTVVVIDHGRIVLDGDVGSLRAASPHRYVDAVVVPGPEHVEAPWWAALDTKVIRHHGNSVRLSVPRNTDPRVLYDAAAGHGRVESFSFEPPDLSEIFAEVVRA